MSISVILILIGLINDYNFLNDKQKARQAKKEN